MDFVFTKYAKKQWDKLDPNAQVEIQQKIAEVKKEPALFAANLKRAWNLPPATHRLRVGNFRLLLECDFELQEHRVLKVGHRKDIYQ